MGPWVLSIGEPRLSWASQRTQHEVVIMELIHNIAGSPGLCSRLHSKAVDCQLTRCLLKIIASAGMVSAGMDVKCKRSRYVLFSIDLFKSIQWIYMNFPDAH